MKKSFTFWVLMFLESALSTQVLQASKYKAFAQILGGWQAIIF